MLQIFGTTPCLRLVDGDASSELNHHTKTILSLGISPFGSGTQLAQRGNVVAAAERVDPLGYAGDGQFAPEQRDDTDQHIRAAKKIVHVNGPGGWIRKGRAVGVSLDTAPSKGSGCSLGCSRPCARQPTLLQIPYSSTTSRVAVHRYGLSMLEMAMVLAIIAILAVLAVPSFEDRIIRNQIAAAVPLADIVKAPIALSWATSQTFPPDNAAAGLPPAEKIVSNYVSAVAVHDGAIDITFGNSANAPINGKTLTLRPAVVVDAPIVPVAWVCGNADAPGQMTIKGENRTDIPTKFLPLNCFGH